MINKFSLFFIFTFVSFPSLAESSNYIESEYIKGVSNSQWKTIQKIGDPLNCYSRIKSLENQKSEIFISEKDFKEDIDAIQTALVNHNIVELGNGTFKINKTIKVNEGNILIGNKNTIIDASEVDTGIRIKKGSVVNLRVDKAKEFGIRTKKDTNIYRVIISNTGIDNPHSTNGYGFFARKRNSFNGCVVSVEVYNGYNYTEDPERIARSGSDQSNGGHADGFRLHSGAYDYTFIDTHAHHNSDDGFDFMKTGRKTDIPRDKVTARIYYSTASFNGKGFTMKADKNDRGARLIYGSLSFKNGGGYYDHKEGNNGDIKVFLLNTTIKNNYKYNISTSSAIVENKNRDKEKLYIDDFPKKHECNWYKRCDKEFINPVFSKRRK